MARLEAHRPMSATGRGAAACGEQPRDAEPRRGDRGDTNAGAATDRAGLPEAPCSLRKTGPVIGLETRGGRGSCHLLSSRGHRGTQEARRRANCRSDQSKDARGARAFQADCAGSIPVTRSTAVSRDIVQRCLATQSAFGVRGAAMTLILTWIESLHQTRHGTNRKARVVADWALASLSGARSSPSGSFRRVISGWWRLRPW
jgi:hypothetical protein